MNFFPLQDAMGVAGTDTALETADIALMTEFMKLPFLRRISRLATQIIKKRPSLRSLAVDSRISDSV